jgi:hypothetical protein
MVKKQQQPVADAVLKSSLTAAMICAGVLHSGCAVVGIAGAMADSYERSGSHKVFSEYDGLRDKSVAVIVAADRSIQAAEAGAVTRLTNGVTNTLVANQQLIGFLGFVPGSKVLEFQFNTPSWTSWSYGRLADEFVVERLVIIDLYEYRLQEPGNAHVWDGLIAARVGFVEADSGTDEFVYTKDIRITYPDDVGYTPNDMSRGHVRAMLEKRLVDRVTWLTFDHDEPNEIEY